MCLGIPGQLVAFDESNDQLARADVSGVTRIINIGLLEDEPLTPGGLGAHSRRLRHVQDRRGGSQPGAGVVAAHGPAPYGDELDAFWSSRIASDPRGG